MDRTNRASLEARSLAGDEGLAVSRVLVVDDDPDINRLLRVRLSSRGYTVDGASNGEDALKRLDAGEPPDLLFLDVSMPGIGGLEVLRQVRDQALDVAVIMMTAFGSEQVAIEALRQGADDYLRKPFEPGEFRAVLGRTVTRLQLSRQNAALRQQLDQKRRQLEAELSRAAQVQSALLPRTQPHLDGFELAATCLPAREVGGDFYDWHEPESGILTLTLGDVMGKGMPAALLMATMRSTLRALSQQNPPAKTMDLAGRALEIDLDRSGSFMTGFHGRLEVGNRTLTYVDAGHGHAFVRRASGAVEQLPPPRGFPLGLAFGEGYNQGSITLETNDVLVIYSDGLVDARPDLALDQRGLASVMPDNSSAQQILDHFVSLATVTGVLTDDLTVVVLRCTGG